MIPAFGFGLLHGLAFATGLSSLDLHGTALIGALLQFNVGVEVGQLAFVAVVLACLRSLRGMKIQWPAAAALAPIYLIGIGAPRGCFNVELPYGRVSDGTKAMGAGDTPGQVVQV